LGTVDRITGLKNRMYFDKRFKNIWWRCHRKNAPISLLMLDLEHLKRIHDRHGHQASDDCLKTTARILRDILQRTGDVAARYGGEEFVIILPATHSDGAIVFAENTRFAVETTNFSYNRQTYKATVSVGVGTYLPIDGI